MDWKNSTRRKQQSIRNSIPPEWRLGTNALRSSTASPNVVQFVSQHLNKSERYITELDAEQLLKDIAVGDLTSHEVTRAFCHRASLAHQLTNCLSEIHFDSAHTRAQELDSYWRENRCTMGPLHGLPVSVTDRFNVEGLESVCGFASWLGVVKTKEDEGVLIQTLRRLGAIVFCKTNVPMSMMIGETTNNVIGSTVNPFNRQLSAGGASGGEGALIALRGSPLGWATDVAGSSRIPSAFCGLYSLKVSEGRLPSSGLETILPGLPMAPGSVGLISGDLSTLKTAFKAMIDASPWLSDVEVLELPWRQEKLDAVRRRTCKPGETNGRLVFGLMQTDDSVNPHAAIKRGLQIVQKALEDDGYEIVDWKPPSHCAATEILFKIFGSTAGKEIRDAVNASGEPVVQQLKAWYDQKDTEPISTDEFWGLCGALQEFRVQYAKYWAAASSATSSGRPIDGVVLPVAPSTAVREGEFRYFGYSAIANALNYPSGTFPVALGDSILDHDVSDSSIGVDVGSTTSSSSRSEDVHGAPIGLQVMCQRHQEERVLGLMGAIKAALTQSGQQERPTDVERMTEQHVREKSKRWLT